VSKVIKYKRKDGVELSGTLYYLLDMISQKENAFVGFGQNTRDKILQTRVRKTK
jgi:hypothetical protein